MVEGEDDDAEVDAVEDWEGRIGAERRFCSDAGEVGLRTGAERRLNSESHAGPDGGEAWEGVGDVLQLGLRGSEAADVDEDDAEVRADVEAKGRVVELAGEAADAFARASSMRGTRATAAAACRSLSGVTGAETARADSTTAARVLARCTRSVSSAEDMLAWIVLPW